MGNVAKYGIYNLSQQKVLGIYGQYKGGGGAADTRLITEWTVGAGDTITLEGQAGTIVTAPYNFDVDWGDSTSDTGLTTNNETHTYTLAGTYVVKISGQFSGFAMGNSTATNKAFLTKFVQWGTETEIRGLIVAFSGCSNMVYEATDFPDISNLSATNGSLMTSFFNSCSSITSVDLTNWTNTSNITRLEKTFYNCTNLTTINLNGWDVSNVTNAREAFYSVGSAGAGCDISLNNWTLSSCTTTQATFQGAKASAFSVLNWTFGTSVNTTNMFRLFDYTSTLDLTTWSGISHLFTMLDMFRQMTCSDINLTGWDTSNVTSMQRTFRDCDNVTTGFGVASGIPALDTSNVTTMIEAFSYNGGLLSLDLSAWDVSNVTNMSQMFRDSNALTSLTVDNWDIASVTNVTRFARYIGALGGVGCAFSANNWTNNNLSSLANMFEGSEFTSFSAENWNLLGTNISMQQMFYLSDGAIDLDLSSWSGTSNVTNMYQMFRTSEFANINLTGWDISNVTNLGWMFSYCYNLENIVGLNGLEASSCTTMINFAAFAYSLKFDTHNFKDTFGSSWAVTSLSQCFRNISVTGAGSAAPNVTNWDTSLVTTFASCFDSADLISGTLEIESWDVSLTTTLQQMFYKVTQLPSPLDLSSWTIPNTCTSLYGTFRASNATDVTFGSGSDFSGITTMGYMFYGITTTNIDFPTNLDLTNLTNASNMLYSTSVMGTANYDNFLIRLDATWNTALSAGTLTMASSQYTIATSGTARANLITNGWTITDGGGV